MKMKKLVLALGLVAGMAHAWAAGPSQPPSEASDVQQFVQDFYDWYVPGANTQPSWELAVKERPYLFSKSIIQGLKDEQASKDESPGYTVDSDFDPFFDDRQNPCGPYKAGKVTMADDTYHVEVFGTCGSSDPNQPDVVAELKRQDGSWVFTNFIYTETDDLFAELKTMKGLRESMKTPPPVTGGYSFKMYVIPEEATKEVLAEEGVLYVSPTPFTERQIAEAKQRYGEDVADTFTTENHITNLCFAMAEEGPPLSSKPGRELFLDWMGGNNTDGRITIYKWTDWWESLLIKNTNGKVSMTEQGGARGWGWKNVRVEAAADQSVTYESCLNYLKMHPKTKAPTAETK